MNVSPTRRLGPRAAAGLAAAALVVLATPATASAADSTVAPATATATLGAVKPLLDCYMTNSDGNYTAILGYANSSSSTRTIPVGSSNTFSPSKYNGPQATTFQPGTHHAVWSVKVYAADVNAGITYTLDGTTLNYASAAYASGICSADVSLPAEGNGTGWTIALVASGVVGAAALWQARRRNTRATVPAEAGDA